MITLDYLIDRLGYLKKQADLTGYESVIDAAVIGDDRDTEYAQGTVLIRLREVGKDARYGTLVISPEKLSEKLN